MRRVVRAVGPGLCVLALTVLGGCAAADPGAGGSGDKAAADAAADQQARPEQSGAFVPVLRRYHDSVQWPQRHDLSAEQMWTAIEPVVGQVVLDDGAARSHVGILNQCAWSLAAIDAVKAGDDTSDARAGLLASTTLMPESGELMTTITDELELGSIETSQQFVTANQCTDDFGP